MAAVALHVLSTCVQRSCIRMACVGAQRHRRQWCSFFFARCAAACRGVYHSGCWCWPAASVLQPRLQVWDSQRACFGAAIAARSCLVVVRATSRCIVVGIGDKHLFDCRARMSISISHGSRSCICRNAVAQASLLLMPDLPCPEHLICQHVLMEEAAPEMRSDPGPMAPARCQAPCAARAAASVIFSAT